MRYALVSILNTFYLILSTSSVSAVNLPTSPTTKFGSGSDLPAQIINAFLLPILTILSFLAALYIVLAGFKFVRSGGDPKAVEEARGRLVFAIVGFIVLILAVAITQIVDKVILGGTGVI